jgi:hypothetical protein
MDLSILFTGMERRGPGRSKSRADGLTCGILTQQGGKMETKMDKALDTIFNWGHGFGGLLFMVLVAAPILGVLIVGFIQVMVLGFRVAGLV